MAKQRFEIEDDNDDSVELDIGSQKSRDLDGDDADPVDGETGLAVFEDLNPRFNLRLEEAATREEKRKPPKKTVSEEDEDDEFPEDEEPPEDEEDEIQDEPEDVEEDDTPEEDESNLTASMRKRLARERRLRAEERENNKELKERLAKLENTLSRQSSEDEFAKVSSDLNTKISDVKAKLRKAKEDGETDAELELQDELIDLKAELKQKKADHDRAKEAAKTQTAADNTSPVVVRKASQWIRKHSRFNKDQVFADFVRALDKKLAREGFDPETDEFYRELDREVRKRYPEEYPGVKKATERREPPTLNTRREAPRKPVAENFQAKGGKVRVTKRQLENMRTFGLDPNNPNDVREYVLSNRSAK